MSHFALRRHYTGDMNAILATEPEARTDAALVELSRAGDHEAFGEIVARYQSPICALAYSACGSVARSEDVAQEIFITAWRKLNTLEEPGKFRAWLYGIARNLVCQTFRQHARNPVAGAVSLEEGSAAAACVSAEPDEQAITKEEETILWHVLAGLPDTYREPMVLFYRQNESIRSVAEILDLSEETVRQRLSRGRAMLNERVANVVQNGLRKSGPSEAFALAVVGSLPILAAATTAKGAVMGMATKGATSQTTGWLGALKGIGLFAGLLAVPAALGSLFGYKLGKDSAGLPQQRESVVKFWKIFGAGLALLLFLPLLLTFGVTGFLHDETRAAFLSVMTFWLGLSYVFVPGAFIYWLWLRRKKGGARPQPPAAAPVNSAAAPAPAGIFWRISRRTVPFIAVAAAGLLIFCFLDTNHNVKGLKPDEVRELIAQAAPGDLRVCITVQHYRSIWGESRDVFRQFRIEDRRPGKKAVYFTLVDDASVALIAQKGIPCPTYYQGRDFEVLGAPGRFLPVLAAFVLAIAILFLIKGRRSAMERTGLKSQ